LHHPQGSTQILHVSTLLPPAVAMSHRLQLSEQEFMFLRVEVTRLNSCPHHLQSAVRRYFLLFHACDPLDLITMRSYPRRCLQGIEQYFCL
jgi:hypothetical protein